MGFNGQAGGRHRHANRSVFVSAEKPAGQGPDRCGNFRLQTASTATGDHDIRLTPLDQVPWSTVETAVVSEHQQVT